MIRAKVKLWNHERGFGFVVPLDGGRDVFVHHTALPPGVDGLARGQLLDLDYTTEAKGPRATFVEVVP